jgi:hypothetical protein
MWVVLLVAIMRREEDIEIGADPVFTKHKMWHFAELWVLCTACKNSIRIGETVYLCTYKYVWIDMCVGVYLKPFIYFNRRTWCIWM